MWRAVPTAVPLYRELFAPGFVGQPYEGAAEWISLFCELDEVMITLQHGVLHREQTLASGGAYCDYFVTGNKE